MGGKLFDTEPVKRENVESIAKSFIRAIKATDYEYHITGSYRRGASICGDIEIVFVAENAEAEAKLHNNIGTQIGFLQSRFGPKMSGRYGCKQFDLHIARPHELGAMLLHTTGSYRFNIYMRQCAQARGWKLNQYGMYHGGIPVVQTREEKTFFEMLNIEYREPSNRSIV